MVPAEKKQGDETETDPTDEERLAFLESILVGIFCKDRMHPKVNSAYESIGGFSLDSLPRLANLM